MSSLVPLPPLTVLFPGLTTAQWRATSPCTDRYNCLAWAAGEDHRRWDFGPRDYWPDGATRRYGIAYLVGAYRQIGFVVCEPADGQTVDPAFEKIVLYRLDAEGTHAAKLLETGVWSSKLGDREDIEHDKPEALAGNAYGVPCVYLKRRRDNRQGSSTEPSSSEPSPAKTGPAKKTQRKQSKKK